MESLAYKDIIIALERRKNNAEQGIQEKGTELAEPGQTS